MQVTTPASPTREIAGSGVCVSLKRPISSSTRWLACVALPPFPNDHDLSAASERSNDRVRRGIRGPAAATRCSLDDFLMLAKCLAKSVSGMRGLYEEGVAAPVHSV